MKIEIFEHKDGYLERIIFTNEKSVSLKAVYTRLPFIQHCSIPESLGCELTGDGYIKTNPSQMKTVDGVYTGGDNTTRMRTVAFLF